MKFPTSATFIRQANIAHQQQVNNDTTPPQDAPTRAREAEPPSSNELLEDKRHDAQNLEMDTGTTRRQAEMTRNWRPWEAATGPRTADGKSRSARNAVKHGGRTASALAELAEFRRMVRQMEVEERETRRRVFG